MRHSESEKIKYINDLYGYESRVLRAIRKSAPKNKAHIQVSPFEGAILKFFTQFIQAKLILEIGTFVGYSTAYMAGGLTKGGKVLSIEKNIQSFNIAQENIIKYNLREKIELFNIDALTFLRTRKGLERADIIFIDGNKSEYYEYLSESMDILRTGGLVIADNTLLFDSVYKERPQDKHGSLMWESMQKFNRKVADSQLFQTIMLPTDSGLTVAIKK
ncbi:MAG: class I SAM-dependent methyltransferase [Candidatus Midichloria sp.]|nr:class I SAM-dependent methyltransferase [Candidatus Midichloria sp.]